MSDSGQRDGHAVLRDAVVEARRRASLTQAQVAEVLQVSQQAFARIETGTRKVGAVELVVISRVLGIDVIELMRRVDQATPADERF
jgi:transcriptional regulator with XRE-family HTH domain